MGMLEGLTSNPYAVIGASVVALIAGFFLQKWIRAWLQRYQDKKNKQEVSKDREKAHDSNEKLNEDFKKQNGG